MRSASQSSDSESSSSDESSSTENAKIPKKKQKTEKKSDSGESGVSFNEEAEFVPEKKMKNSDFKDLLFGEKKPKKATDADGDDAYKQNYMTGRKYSERFYTLLGTRKSLPAWQAKK